MKLNCSLCRRFYAGVAPRRGAWIETVCEDCIGEYYIWSHPAGVRGLKLFWLGRDGFSTVRRTPQGCVD